MDHEAVEKAVDQSVNATTRENAEHDLYRATKGCYTDGDIKLSLWEDIYWYVRRASAAGPLDRDISGQVARYGGDLDESTGR